MSWQLVNTGGKVVIAATSGGTTLYDGAGIEDCSLSVRRTNAEFKPMEQKSPTRRGTQTDFRITLNKGFEDTTPQNLVATLSALDRVYVTYKSADDVTTFAGYCTWEDIGDTQRSNEFARQSLSLINDGDPDTPDMS